MAYNKFLVVLTFIFSLLLSSCGGKEDCSIPSEISEINLTVDIERLDFKLDSLNSLRETANFLNKNQGFLAGFLEPQQYQNPNTVVGRFHNLITNPGFDSLQSETRKVFDEQKINEIENELELLFKHIKYYYPDYNIPKVQTVTTGIIRDLYVTDSVIVIGLDYFLGEKGRYRPQQPQYILDHYTPEYIVPKIALLISNKYNKVDLNDKTLLADMIYYGKSYAFVNAVMPCLDERKIMWYSEQEMEAANNNAEIIYSYFVSNELFYDTSPMAKRKYVMERPKTPEIGDQCPGRIGTWLGWQVVQRYQDKTDKSLQELMSTREAEVIFQKAAYKP
ncbi:gliding motility lipoprotein GldB [Mangrovivirga cuniculi]|uniref:Gliding motility lipoprotein GldB n=1 Tax=Mangrovivirga cuniculi TaxID=2715131 RepID=A0A4D7JBE9_9BACT|nr:gliding motility lipoprotein GldB [Mangrovivirga cuniculi]QCK13709.1 gliding motility lipoprotein GldB [Mangrovivirga cuniculi]